MKKINEILSKIKLDASTEIPAIITSYSLDELEKFEIGQSRDESHKAFFVYQDKLTTREDDNRLELTYQLQLPGVTVLEAAKYTDAIIDWIVGSSTVSEYDFNRIGYDMLESLTVDTYPNVGNITTVIFFDLVIAEYIDSCS